MKARILSIEKHKALVALLDEKGRCGSGSCGGCSCSSKLKTMKIELPCDVNWKEGDDLTLVSQGAVLDAILLIALPLSSIGLLSAGGFTTPQALGSGALLFILSSLFLRVFRGKKKLVISRIQEKNQSL